MPAHGERGHQYHLAQQRYGRCPQLVEISCFQRLLRLESLCFDSWLYLVGYYNDPNESLFAHLADITSTLDNFPLRIAHFIRNTAYGNVPTAEEIKILIETLDKEDKLFMAEIFLPLDKHEKLESALSASRINADTPIANDSDINV